MAERRATAWAMVAIGLVGVAGGLALRRMRSARPAPPLPSARDAAAAEAAAPPAVSRASEAGTDARPGTAPDLVAAAAAIAARLYQCSPAAPGWAAGQLALGKFQLSGAGTLVRGLVLPARSNDGGLPSLLARHKVCFDQALAASTADAGAATTVWFPLAFEDSGSPDGGAQQVREPPAVDLLAVPMYYPRSELPRSIHGDWLGLCGGGGSRPPWPETAIGPTIEQGLPPTWRPVTLSRAVDEENEDFDDVNLEGCGAGERLVPAVRGAIVAEHPTPARVTAGPRTGLGERTIRFGKRRFQVWQDKVSQDQFGEGASLIALAFDGQIQVLLPDSNAFDYALIWAGDLDGDHRLDLIVSDGEFDEPRFTLFLSSSAPTPLPVARVTEAQISGD